jgi:hypothetical protein
MSPSSRPSLPVLNCTRSVALLPASTQRHEVTAVACRSIDIDIDCTHSPTPIFIPTVSHGVCFTRKQAIQQHASPSLIPSFMLIVHYILLCNIKSSVSLQCPEWTDCTIALFRGIPMPVLIDSDHCRRKKGRISALKKTMTSRFSYVFWAEYLCPPFLVDPYRCCCRMLTHLSSCCCCCCSFSRSSIFTSITSSWHLVWTKNTIISSRLS